MPLTLKALIAAACGVVIVGGIVLARDRYKTSSCQSTAQLYDYVLGHEDINAPDSRATADAYYDCVHAGWIAKDAWKNL